MNIFKLDDSPELAAQYHCDAHTIKMPLEYAQMLCTAIRLRHGEPGELLLPDPVSPGRQTLVAYPHVLKGMGEEGKSPLMYLVSHVNHPCCLWVRQSRTNWLWLQLLALNVGLEFFRTYGKVHASTKLVASLEAPQAKSNSLTDLPVVVPDDCLMTTDVESYREYYRTHKKNLLHYSRREVPYWLN